MIDGSDIERRFLEEKAEIVRGFLQEREIRAVYTRENKPRLTLAAAYTRRKRNDLYEYGLY